MNRFTKSAVLAATALLAWLPISAQAQGGGRGNFDPAEMRQRMMERYRETLEVKSDDEWKVIEPRIQKVTEARRELTALGGMGRGMGLFGPGAGRRGGGGDNQADRPQGERRRNAGGGFGGQQSAAVQALQKAVDDKASSDQLKSKVAAYREERKQKQANLEKAQEDLKKVLSVRQEAVALLNGLID